MAKRAPRPKPSEPLASTLRFLQDSVRLFKREKFLREQLEALQKLKVVKR